METQLAAMGIPLDDSLDGLEWKIPSFEIDDFYGYPHDSGNAQILRAKYRARKGGEKGGR